MGQTVGQQLSVVIIASIIANVINNSIFYCSLAPVDDLLVLCLLLVPAERNSLAILEVGFTEGLRGSKTQHGGNLLLGRYLSRCAGIALTAVSSLKPEDTWPGEPRVLCNTAKAACTKAHEESCCLSPSAPGSFETFPLQVV